MKKLCKVVPIAIVFIVVSFVLFSDILASDVVIAQTKREDAKSSAAPSENDTSATKSPEVKENEALDTLDKNKKKVEDKADKILDGIKEKSKNEFDSLLEKADGAKQYGETSFWVNFMKVHSILKEFAPIIIILSLTFGAIVVFFARLNKALRRWAIGVLIVGIPLVVLICVYGMPYLHHAFS